jgi:hypothetical protein
MSQTTPTATPLAPAALGAIVGVAPDDGAAQLTPVGMRVDHTPITWTCLMRTTAGLLPPSVPRHSPGA